MNTWNEFVSELQMISKLVDHYSNVRWEQFQTSGMPEDMPSLRNLASDVKKAMGRAFGPVSVGRLRGVISYLVNRRSSNRLMTNCGVIPLAVAQKNGMAIPLVIRLNQVEKSAVEKILKGAEKYRIAPPVKKKKAA